MKLTGLKASESKTSYNKICILKYLVFRLTKFLLILTILQQLMNDNLTKMNLISPKII